MMWCAPRRQHMSCIRRCGWGRGWERHGVRVQLATRTPTTSLRGTGHHATPPKTRPFHGTPPHATATDPVPTPPPPSPPTLLTRHLADPPHDPPLLDLANHDLGLAAAYRRCLPPPARPQRQRQLQLRHTQLPGSVLHMTTTGHSSFEPEIIERLVAATDGFAR